MARRSRMSMLKRQREVRKAEKAAQKRAKRHGIQLERPAEPRPTIGTAELLGHGPSAGPADSADEEQPDKPAEDESQPANERVE